VPRYEKRLAKRIMCGADDAESLHSFLLCNFHDPPILKLLPLPRRFVIFARESYEHRFPE
jgi:hypothetical protein